MRFFDVKLLVVSLLCFMSLHSAAGQLGLATSPLTVSTNALPNIMLLMDTSGSMNAIIEDDGYTGPSTAVDQWDYRDTNSGSLSDWWAWTEIDLIAGYVSRGALRQGECSFGYFQFRKQSANESKCLAIPAALDSDNNSLGNSTLYSAGYLTYLLNTYANNTNLSGVIPTEYRMDVAKEVAKELIEQTSPAGSPKARFGLSRFNGSTNNGALMLAACNQDTSNITGNNIISSIDSLSAFGATPLAEALYDVTRYFRGLSSTYGNFSNLLFPSPIQYRCQQNFAIVLTDGFPTLDNNFPNNDSYGVSSESSGKNLPDWDGLSPTTLEGQYPNFPQYSDGYDVNSTSGSAEGTTLYLDDIALFAQELDLKPNGSELDNDGKSYNDPNFLQQNLNTYTVGFSIDNQMLNDAAEYGTGEAFTANNREQLLAALTAAVDSIIARSGSAASAAASSGSVQEGTKVYQARFNSSDWSGQLLAFEFDEDGNLDTSNTAVSEGALWDAGSNIPAWSERNIFSNNTSGGIRFRWGQFTPLEKLDYFSNNQSLLQYIRGRQGFDEFRARTSLLGDIVNSTPKFQGPPDSDYSESLESESYASFKTTYANRDPLVYVGANDGMLHAFDAETGTERMAFIPSAVLPNLESLSDTGYSHQYFVDGTPTIRDAFVGGEWRTILVGGLNLGGKSIYALDVTDPSQFSESNDNAQQLFKWEFTNEGLGFTYSQPLIVKLHDGKWYAVFGSGYNPDIADGDGRIFIVDLDTGTLTKTLTTNVGIVEDLTGLARPNGIGKIAPVDLNNDNVVDYIYAGDLFGNLWKFDLTGSSPSDWALDYKLFEACSGVCTNSVTSLLSDNHQAITTQPVVGSHSSGKGVMVYFGTGKYLETTDNNGASGGVQSIYGIWDTGDPNGVSGRSQLQEQSIMTEGTHTFTDDNDTETTSDDTSVSNEYRITTSIPLEANDKGWYLDLVSPTNGEEGERQVTDIVLRRGVLYFNTSIPEADTCSPTGTSWLMAVNAENGNATHSSTFDYNQDGVYDDEDKVSDVIASGIKSDSNAAPVILAGDNQDVVIGNDSCDGTDSCIEGVNKGTGLGRQYWRQIFQ